MREFNIVNRKFPIQDVIIIGAGTSGLTVAYHLLKRGIRPLIIDAASNIASAWRFRHPQLSLNTHRLLSGLPGMPIPNSKGTFVSRNDYIAYLEAYANKLQQEHQLEIVLNTKVKCIKSFNGVWSLTSDKNHFSTSNLIIATGPDKEPYLPLWRGMHNYEGTIKHVANFGDIEQYDDKDILIIGGANSGIDAANHLVRRARYASLTISMRNGCHLMPTYVVGIPSQLLGPVLAKLPIGFQDKLARLFSDLCFGDLTQYGIKTPDLGLASRMLKSGVAPGFDNGFVKALKLGKVKIAPEIDKFTTSKVLFKETEHIVSQDKQPRYFDHVICATGYQKGLDQLLPSACLNDDGSNHDIPGIYLFGMKAKIQGSIYARLNEAEKLAERIAASTVT